MNEPRRSLALYRDGPSGDTQAAQAIFDQREGRHVDAIQMLAAHHHARGQAFAAKPLGLELLKPWPEFDFPGPRASMLAMSMQIFACNGVRF